MSDLVGNPEDRFSHNEAHLTLPSTCKFCRIGSVLVCFMSFPPSTISRRAVFSYWRESDHGKITEQAQNYACLPRNDVQIDCKIEHVSPLTSKLCWNTTFQTKCRLNDAITGHWLILVMFSCWVIVHVVILCG